jgi:hypothetical protein
VITRETSTLKGLKKIAFIITKQLFYNSPSGNFYIDVFISRGVALGFVILPFQGIIVIEILSFL